VVNIAAQCYYGERNTRKNINQIKKHTATTTATITTVLAEGAALARVTTLVVVALVVLARGAVVCDNERRVEQGMVSFAKNRQARSAKHSACEAFI
jgi:hypothetical protein